MVTYQYPSGRELRDLLPHPSFSISFRRLDTRTVIVVHCACGRKLDMLDSLDGSILLYWLADHDDEIFLTPGERTTRENEQMTRVVFGSGPGASSLHAQISAQFPEFAEGLPKPLPGPGPTALREGGRALVYDPDGLMGERP